jgi:hemerythrin superfamily protein
MESASILAIMIQDHRRIMNKLTDIKKTQEDNLGTILEKLNAFEWDLEKHFFVEERAIFTSYNATLIKEGQQLFDEISKQHTSILESVESLRDRLRMNTSIEIGSLVVMLTKHKNHEERNVYPLLDENIPEGEKRFMIERIAEIK